MQKLLNIFIFLCASVPAWAQVAMKNVPGTVSFTSAQSVYIKFASTKSIEVGDTLYRMAGDVPKPFLLVKNKSSTSVVCNLLSTEKAKAGDVFYHQEPEKSEEKQVELPKQTTPPRDTHTTIAPLVIEPEASDKEPVLSLKQRLRGRISAASYSNFYKDEPSHRLRYSLNFTGNHIGNSRFSTDCYVVFRHTVGEWDSVKTNLNQALKIYALNATYSLDARSSISIGRKINTSISSMGVMDGLQLEKGLGRHFKLGAMVGSRPDAVDYSINLNLFQYGSYVNFASGKAGKNQENTLAYIEQRNGSAIDRRFLYLQHNNALVKDVNLFASMEVDMYKSVRDTQSNALNMTNLLVTLRYRASDRLGLNMTYDNRKNIIYYETYKSYIDQLIEDETRHSLRLGGNYKLSKRAMLGANVSKRFQKSGANNAQNLNAYVNFNQLPRINANLSVSANILTTNYLNSGLYGVRLSKDLIKRKLTGELNVRYATYDYHTSERKLSQWMSAVDFSYNFTSKLALHVYYEGIFDAENPNLHRFNTKILQRF